MIISSRNPRYRPLVRLYSYRLLHLPGLVFFFILTHLIPFHIRSSSPLFNSSQALYILIILSSRTPFSSRLLSFHIHLSVDGFFHILPCLNPFHILLSIHFLTSSQVLYGSALSSSRAPLFTWSSPWPYSPLLSCFLFLIS